jgi:hypothetical protein
MTRHIRLRLLWLIAGAILPKPTARVLQAVIDAEITAQGGTTQREIARQLLETKP